MTLVSPKLQYACSAWDPHYQRDRAALERVQRKAARFVTGNYDRTTSVTEMLRDGNAARPTVGHTGNNEKTCKALHYVQDVPRPPRWGLGGLFDNKQRKENPRKP